ncbi:MAG TPA: DNA cytosine methyltransferase [Ruminiclostridium sp.]|nr:DNA cytosine methyltransferase [Ruminiclostridium sp.]
MNETITLGSLFDGIGGFPLAGIHQGFIPLWASEIEAFPIAVTKLRLPKMLHVGDITRLKGETLPRVDVVCGGSPCQDLSVAGKRAGLKGERSGLFMEQIRVIKEMRKQDEASGRADAAVRPRYMVWENVPGAFSSSKGEDFRAVLEEICRIADSTVYVPGPPGGVWQSAGAILGYKFSVAWRVYDAQYWGLAQRRKRIYLVADFGGLTAPEILFKQDRLFGNPETGEKAREGAADCSQACIGASGRSDNNGRVNTQGHINIRNAENSNIYRDNSHVAFACNQRDEVRDLHYISAVIQAQPGIKQQTFIADIKPVQKEPRYLKQDDINTICLNDQGGIAILQESYCIAGNIIDRQDHNGGNGIGVQQDISYTLNTIDRHCVFSQQRSDEYKYNDIASTQSARQYKDATDLVCDMDVAGVDCRSGRENGDLCGTLQAHPSGGYSLNTLHPVRTGKLIRRLTPLECERLMGFPDYWTDIPGASDSARYKALGNSVAIPCVENVLQGIAYFLQKN